MSTAVEIPVAGVYRLDAAASTISFTTRHMFGLAAVRGTFAPRAGLIEVADPVTASTVRATVAADSVDTGLGARDRMVRSATYLDTEQHPEFTFVSTEVAREGEHWVLRGTLTVRGVSQRIDVPVDQVRVTDGTLRAVATAEVDRYAFGITAMRGMTGRRLTLRLEIVASLST
ncbi:YceI family protein [Actinophytocola sediminis]